MKELTAKKALNVPPFPPLKWREFAWEGTITLPSWAGFQCRRSPYRAHNRRKPSDGAARLRVTVVGYKLDDAAERPAPDAAQIAAMQHLLDYEVIVASAVLQAIFERYPEEKEAYEEACDDKLPEITEPSGLRSLMGLSDVHVLHVAKDNVAYIGFEFGCEWEEEHGAGVMTHLGRIVNVGHSDSAFVEWIAERDAERCES